uniref:Suckerin-6 n=1 Tax=Dosidicus gigas TaxID=346249 RepID=A0A081DU74_DOSGI
MTTTATLLALMSVIGLGSCFPGFMGGYGGAYPIGSSYSQVTHHGPYGMSGIGGFGGLGYGASLPVSSVSHVSHGAHYGWGGMYGGGVQVSQSPVMYQGYSVGAPHVQSMGVHYPTTTSVSHSHGGYLGGLGGIGAVGGYGGYGGYGLAGGLGHSVSTVSHGIGHVGMGMGYGYGGFGHY